MSIPYYEKANPTVLPARVRVYRNLHKTSHTGGPVYSVQDMVTKRVVAHVGTIVLSDPEFKVYETGRQRVLREQRKHVHAYIIGSPAKTIGKGDLRSATYNPYQTEAFIDRETGHHLHNATSALITNTGVHYTT